MNIPKILHFSIPSVAESARIYPKFWEYLKKWRVLHQGWEIKVWQDGEFEESLFPLTHHLWELCTHPVQMSGLLRLEAVYHFGGFYIDSDVEGYRSFEPLRHLPGSFVVGTEDGIHKTDAVFGAAKGSLVLKGIIDRVVTMDMAVGPLYTGPHNMTAALDEFCAFPECLRFGEIPEYTLLPEKVFYPYDYKKKHDPRLVNRDWSDDPEVFCSHRWNFSWRGY